MKRPVPRIRAFHVVVTLKGLYGAIETIVGAGLLFIQTGAIIAFFNDLVAPELVEDPNDTVAALVVHWANNLSHDTQVFAAIYLLLHGIAKIILVTFLLLGRTWAYPVAIVLFSAFLAYAGYRLSLKWSWLLVALVALDLITIWLIAREWSAPPFDRPRTVVGG
jgi:uncharacterized membrane protein